ncbi:MAG: Ig-like domain repeat protein [Candidatus Acidiferrum sp.]
MLRGLGRKVPVFAALLAAFSFFAAHVRAQVPAERINAQINNSERATIQGSHHPLARPENEVGRVPAQTKLEGMSLVFSRTPAQEADLQSLIAAQQNPASPLYQKWLTAEEFGARFGVADADIAKVQLWLQQQGFSIESISRSRNSITFSGTVEQAESAFETELHFYNVNGKREFAPSVDITIPAALFSIVHSVTNLSTFRPKPHVKLSVPQPAPTANFTSSQSGNHFLTPKDIATIYDINAAYNAGFTGTGQSIAVVGQSSVVLADIEHFQTAAGLPVKDPTLVLVPNSGTATAVSGDQTESDLDLEYSGAISKGATIFFVFTGNNANFNVWNSLIYAVDNRTAPVISISYGTCELGLPASQYSSLNAVLAQAASQGQTVVAASGDSGSTDCQSETGLTAAQQEALAVDFPASSQYVTGMGGSEFPTADVSGAMSTTYWQPASGTTDVISSALSYIPEQVWNDDSPGVFSSGGGGISRLTTRPTWQTGVPGIPSGTFRLVPDVSLTASPSNAGFLYCSSDTKTGVTGSCSNGFRDTANTNLTVAGGTSFDAPIFSGMLALVLQKLNSTGLGVANSTLYTLAANSATYASAFHDITSGNNECTAAGSTVCTAGASQYPATTGYDEASGLGSVDFFNLLQAWPTSGSTLVASTTTLSAATTTPASGASDAITIKVASASSSSTTTPTGTVSVAVDGTAAGAPLTLNAGSATYTFSSTTVGSHTIAATYSGDTIYASSSNSTTVTVAAPQAVPSTTTLTPTTSTPANGATDLITIKVASASSSSSTTPTGTVSFAVDGTAAGTPLSLNAGSATYTFSSTIAGAHTITVTYSGDSIYASSTSAPLALTVSPAPVASATTLSAATLTPASGASDAITIKVASASTSSTTTPTGTLTVAVDGTATGTPLTLNAGSATYTFSSTTTGAHTITATYSGDSTYAASTSSALTLTVPSPPKSFALAAANATVPSGNTGTSAITITPQNGYTGTVAWTVSSAPTIANACFSLPNAAVSSTTAVTATLTIRTSATACATGAVSSPLGTAHKSVGAGPVASRNDVPPTSPWPASQASLGLAALLFVGLLGFRSRNLRTFAAVLLLAVVGLSIGGCAGTSSSPQPTPTPSNAPKGTYTVTVVGTDTTTSSITTTTTLTLTID